MILKTADNPPIAIITGGPPIEGCVGQTHRSDSVHELEPEVVAVTRQRFGFRDPRGLSGPHFSLLHPSRNSILKDFTPPVARDSCEGKAWVVPVAATPRLPLTRGDIMDRHHQVRGSRRPFPMVNSAFARHEHASKKKPGRIREMYASEVKCSPKFGPLIKV